MLDDAELSQAALQAITLQTDFIVDVSLVNLTFTDEYPADLSALLDIESLDNVRVDPSLYNRYTADFDAFAAMPGNTVTVLPEPSSVLSLVLASVACFRCRNLLR